ncbi:hypothetical protein TNCV_4094451, partial [Trichonephila clavipes]
MCGCFGETYCSTLTSSENTQQLKQMLIEEWAPYRKNVAPAGSEYAETVRSNHL